MPDNIKYSFYCEDALESAIDQVTTMRHPFLTPEHLLYALVNVRPVRTVLADMNIDKDELTKVLYNYLSNLDKVPGEGDYKFEASNQVNQVFSDAIILMFQASAKELEITHVLMSLMNLKDSLAGNLLNHYVTEYPELMTNIIWTTKEMYEELQPEKQLSQDAEMLIVEESISPDDSDEDSEGENYESTDESGEDFDYNPDDNDKERGKLKGSIRGYVTCINDHLKDHNPLIGRDVELERTIHVLCRKDKNNPLHVGEPGVGKTALIYGLAQRIEDGNVPDMLKGFKIYQIDMAAMVAGTQYRGDFEKRIKMTMDYLSNLDNAIVYIDEIHNIMGTGAVSDSSLDASNMLKPYLEGGKLRFIGSTTYEELNRYLSKSKGILRRFQQIDILEPSVDEAIGIINGLKENYESFHHVVYSPVAIDYAVRASAKHIMGRFLPDKAIDLIDEAGAYRHIHPTKSKVQTVDKALIDDVLMKVMKINATAMKEDNNAQLKTLEKRIKSVIYGQDQAVREVVEAVQLSKAGLIDDGKPLASLLFVGPTGVGKTEVARVLARELGVELVRFDMSEYTEKHTVAKLIGSPAGYVGYEDGGLLTDAIRKTPNCVLLLDEIEKAHEDIYNILLQVMDYARLTDNKGRHADFRNVVLIMTSNAGAQHAGLSVGFDSRGSRGGDMLKQVKKTFKPEFINRLSNIVVFNDMDETMAGMILDKRLRELQAKLTPKKVKLVVEKEARALLKKEGFTAEYGARELDRVLHRELKTRLMRELLFGKLKRGGTVRVTVVNDAITLNCEK